MISYWRYFLYVLEHKLNVCIECWKEGLYLQGILHDMSKFSYQEFTSYALKFYSNQKNENIELKWKKAWLHHQNSNKHHWEYWIVDKYTREALPMPKKYIVEMICDWKSFSRRWGRKVKDTNLVDRMMTSESIILHPETRKDLENYLKRNSNMKH